MRIAHHDLDRDVLVVAEIGNNHEGDFGRAKAMIEAAAEAGAGAVKFQTIVPTKLVSARDTARVAQLSKYQLTYDQFASLAETAQRAGVTFLSTPFDVESVAALEPLVPAYKVASGDNDFVALLEAVARTGKPIILSTGMADLAQVANSKAIVEATWRQTGSRGELALLHCTVSYPTAPEDANLGAIREIAGLGNVVGFSDHTMGIEAAVLSVALGARIIEKHFTLDKNFSDFHDHKLSADPREMAELVRRVRAATVLLGSGRKDVRPCEAAVMTRVRRGLAAARDLPAGTVIGAEDLIAVRPRAGLAPGHEGELIGRRLTTARAHGEPITLEHFA